MKQKQRGPTMQHSPHNTLSPDEIWLPKQTAEAIGVAEATLATWRSTQRYPLKYLKVGKLIRYRKSDVLAFLDFCQKGDE